MVKFGAPERAVQNDVFASFSAKIASRSACAPVPPTRPFEPFCPIPGVMDQVWVCSRREIRLFGHYYPLVHARLRFRSREIATISSISPDSPCAQGRMPPSKRMCLSFRIFIGDTLTSSSRPETLKWPRVALNGAPQLEGHST